MKDRLKQLIEEYLDKYGTLRVAESYAAIDACSELRKEGWSCMDSANLVDKLVKELRDERNL